VPTGRAAPPKVEGSGEPRSSASIRGRMIPWLMQAADRGEAFDVDLGLLPDSMAREASSLSWHEHACALAGPKSGGSPNSASRWSEG